MEQKPQELFSTISSYVIALLDTAQLKVLLVAENGDGERYWAGSGKLRNEFVNEGKIDNRSWGMLEFKVGRILGNFTLLKCRSYSVNDVHFCCLE